VQSEERWASLRYRASPREKLEALEPELGGRDTLQPPRSSADPRKRRELGACEGLGRERHLELQEPEE